MSNPNELFTITLCRADWERVIQSLRDEAFQLSQESQRACSKGAVEYCTLLWEECALHNGLADQIDFEIPG